MPGMRLSQRQPRAPPTRMLVLRSTVTTLSATSIPVCTACGFPFIHLGSTSPKKSENPTMYKLRGELRSTYCSADSPANPTQMCQWTFSKLRLERYSYVIGQGESITECGYHAEHDAEDAAHDGLGDGEEDGPELSAEAPERPLIHT